MFDFENDPRSNLISTHLAAEAACVFPVLGDFNLLDILTETGTISGSVLSANANLLGSLGLKNIHSIVININRIAGLARYLKFH